MPQDIYPRLRRTGHLPAPQWVIERVSVPIGKQHVDARKPADLTIWPDLESGVSDRDVQKFWADASKKYAYSCQWDQSSIRGSVAIALNGGGAIDHDIAVTIERSDRKITLRLLNIIIKPFNSNQTSRKRTNIAVCFSSRWVGKLRPKKISRR